MELVTLNNGVTMPILGYETYQTPASITERCVRDAIETGYRLVDTAQCYGNEREVGAACRRCGLPRDELFVTTKLWACRGYTDTLRSIDGSLSRFDLGHIDLLLIHEPSGDIPEIYRAMESAYAEGKVRAIGVSNFLSDRFEELLRTCKVVPAVNQTETHVFRQQNELRALEQKVGTVHQAWSPLANGRHGIFSNPVLAAVAANHGKSTAQVALRFLYQLRVPFVVKSTHRDRMEDNLNIFDFNLTGPQMDALEALDEGRSLFGWW